MTATPDKRAFSMRRAFFVRPISSKRLITVPNHFPMHSDQALITDQCRAAAPLLCIASAFSKSSAPALLQTDHNLPSPKHSSMRARLRLSVMLYFPFRRFPSLIYKTFIRLTSFTASFATSNIPMWRADTTVRKIARFRWQALFIAADAEGRMEQFAAFSGTGKYAMNRTNNQCRRRAHPTGEFQ